MKYFSVKRYQIAGVFVALSLLVLAGCQEKKAERAVEAIKFDDMGMKNLIILRVQDISYTNSDFEDYLRFTIGDDYKALPLLSLGRLLDGFIEEKILLEASRNKGITLTEEEQKEYLAKVSSESVFNGKKQPLGKAEAEILIERLFVEKYTFEIVKDTEVRDEEIQEYYGLNRREFLRPERVEVSQILLKSEEKAVELLKEMKDSSQEDFKRIAQKESAGVEASKGGKMGVFEMGQLPDEMEKVIFALNPGELSSVVESSYGYHIFRLDARYEPELISGEEAAASITVKILDQKIKDRLSSHISELKEEIDWEFHKENLFFPYQRNTDD
jgi:parvulin-like peptidyl-prolyl isomerase